MKKKKTIIILIVLLIICISGDIYLVMSHQEKPKINQPIIQEEPQKNQDGLRIIKSVTCIKEDDNNYEETLNIKFKFLNKYSFVIAENNRMFDNLDETTLTFENISDLNEYYDYITTITKDKFTILQMNKNDQDLNIYYNLKINWWGYENYSDEYLDILENKSGYTCEVEDM